MTGRVGHLSVILVVLLVFFIPAWNSFFTNDDFFHLYVSRPQNLVRSFTLFPHFRPLTTQGYYLLSAVSPDPSPQILRVVSLTVLLIIGYQVYLLSRRLFSVSSASLTASMLYLTSATHYAHLNYAGAFQELGMTAFVLAGILSLWERPLWLSPLFFLLALGSKETAVVYPVLLLLLYLVIPAFRHRFSSIRRFTVFLLWHVLVLAVYAVFRIGFFGFAAGDSYLWQFSPSAFNTLGWYGLWSFSLPEMWVDFIGPGLHLNPNLFRFWGSSTILIFSLFLVLVSIILAAVFAFRDRLKIAPPFALAFIVSLGPLLFLPWHKFTFYLTLSLVSLAVFLGRLFSGSRYRKAFITVWILISLFSYQLSLETNWITRGAATTARFDTFFRAGQMDLAGRTLVFYDTPADSTLPWSPTEVLKDTLSDNNYFRVYSPSTRAVYSRELPSDIKSGELTVISRQFLGY